MTAASDFLAEHVIVIPVTVPPPKKVPCPTHASAKYGTPKYVHLCAECRALNK